MFRASQCSSSGDRIVLIHNLVWLVCVSACLVCRSGGNCSSSSWLLARRKFTFLNRKNNLNILQCQIIASVKKSLLFVAVKFLVLLFFRSKLKLLFFILLIFQAELGNTMNFKIVWPCIVTNSLWIKPTDALNFNFISIATLHVSGSLSAHHQEFLDVHRHWYILCRFDYRLLPGAGWNILILATIGHKICIDFTNADVRLRNLDDGQKGCPKHVES